MSRLTIFLKIIAKGEDINLDTVKQRVAFILHNKTDIVNALRKLTNAELNKKLDYVHRGRITKKDEMVDSIYDNILSGLYYDLSGKDSISYGWDENAPRLSQKLINGVLAELTPKPLKNRFHRIRKNTKMLSQNERPKLKVSKILKR